MDNARRRGTYVLHNDNGQGMQFQAKLIPGTGGKNGPMGLLIRDNRRTLSIRNIYEIDFVF